MKSIKTIAAEVRNQLELQDIILLDAKSQQSFEAKGEVVQQSRHSANSTCSGDQVQALVDIGVRLIDAKEQIRCEISARFLLVYQCKQPLNTAQLDALTDNFVHNAWPFWRQHVYDLVQRGRMPRIDVPLFGGFRKQPVVKKTKI